MKTLRLNSVQAIFLIIVLFTSLNFAQGGAELILLMSSDAVVVDPTQYSVNLASASTEFMTKTSPSNTNIAASDFSIMAWVKIGAASASYRIINTDNNPTRGWDLFIDINEKVTFYSNAATGAGLPASTAVLTAGTWYLILITGKYNGANTDLISYINSITADDTDLADANVVSVTNTVHIGRWGYNNADNMNGEIGELQVLKGHVLTLAERTTLFTDGIQDSWSAGTVVAHYKWAGATDAVFLQDESASDNDLTGNNVTQAGDQVIYSEGYP